jgi:parvulin-like peptidyl-prolyl isomerase
MFARFLRFTTSLILFLSYSLFTAGCRPSSPPQTGTPAATGASPTFTTPELTPTASPTLLPTKVLSAARVNGIDISLAVYNSELEMYAAERGTELAAEDEKHVLDDLLDRALLASTATENGFVVDTAMLEERIGYLSEQLGGQQALAGWISTYGFDDQTFQETLRLSIASAWMRDKIVNEVPRTAEQVHIRQVLLYDAPTASEVYQQLQSGNSFRNLALQYDPATGGDLGWFPRGYLPHPEVEEAAFNLQPEQYSEIIETPAGFHIIQLLEKEPQRLLSPSALLALQNLALHAWLEQNRAQSQIEVFLP